MIEQNFSAEVNLLATMSLLDAQREAIGILGKMKFKNAAKKVRLTQDISRARRATEVCRIMYYTILAGEGLSVVGGKWQTEFA